MPYTGLKAFGGLGAIDWTEEEDAKLRAAVEALGDMDWTAVAHRVPRRTAQQCLSRWTRALKAGEAKKEWQDYEDQVVREAVHAAGGPDKVVWTKIAQALPGRIGKQCRERWYYHLDRESIRGKRRVCCCGIAAPCSLIAPLSFPRKRSHHPSRPLQRGRGQDSLRGPESTRQQVD